MALRTNGVALNPHHLSFNAATLIFHAYDRVRIFNKQSRQSQAGTVRYLF